MKKEVCDALAIHNESSSAFDAHSSAAQGGTHIGQRAGTVLECNRYILHVVSSLAGNKNRISVVPSKRMPFVPNPMTHTGARLLEFETLRELLAGYPSSPRRRPRVAALPALRGHSWVATPHPLPT